MLKGEESLEVTSEISVENRIFWARAAHHHHLHKIYIARPFCSATGCSCSYDYQLTKGCLSRTLQGHCQAGKHY